MNAFELKRFITYFTLCKRVFEGAAVAFLNSPESWEGHSPGLFLQALKCSDETKKILLFLKLARAMRLNLRKRDVVRLLQDTVGWFLYLGYCTLNL